MHRFLISLLLLLVCTSAQAGSLWVYQVTDPRAKSSYRRWYTDCHGNTTLWIVKKPKREVTYYPALMDVPYGHFSPPSTYRERPVPKPVIITNPFVKE